MATKAGGLTVLAITVAVALRLVGLGWGLPHAARYYPYHPDEPLIAIAVLRIDFSTLQLKPGLYNYGSLSLYLDRLALTTAAALGWISVPPTGREAIPLLIGAVIRIGRWLTLLMGVLTVAVTAALGARLFGPAAGGLAALLLAVAPLHLAHGHYSTVDVPAAWWTTLCLLLCAACLRTPNRGALAAAGACAGLAASTKYNAGLVLLAPLYALAVTWRREEWYASDRAAALLYVPMAAAAAFLLTTPGVFLDTAKFWEDFTYELWHSGSGHGLVFVNTAPAWLYHFVRSMPDGLGWPLTLAVIIGVIGAVARRRPEDGLLLSFVLPYYLLIGCAEVKFSRYLLPILPALILLAARALAGEPDKSNPPVGSAARPASGIDAPSAILSVPQLWRARLRWIVLLIVLLWTGTYGVAMAKVFAGPDPRDQAAAWIKEQQRVSDRVALVGEPWFYTPPLAPTLGCTHALLPVCREGLPAGLLAPAHGEGTLPPAVLDEERPRFVVASEFEYEDPLRLRAEGQYSDRTLELLDHLRGRYRLARTFRNRPALGPIHWFERGSPVHDLLYPMPDVRVYERAGSGG